VAGPAWTRWSTGSATTSPSNPDLGSAPARTGRDGLLHLGFERRGARTVLTERRFRLPLQALEPIDLDGGGAAALMLLNPTGGIVGGDVLDTRVTLGPGSHVCLTTPAASRVYRTAGAGAVQRFSGFVGEGAVLEYLPDHLIPSPGARLRQRTEITLAAGASAIVADAWAVGRVARGERWLFSELDLALAARDPRGWLLRERTVVTGDRRWDRLGNGEGAAYVATFSVLAPARERWDDLLPELRSALAQMPGAGGGATELARGGLLARVLAPTAPDLVHAIETLWALCRRAVLGLPPVDLRKF
jgi:urease accessory protein